ncbi:hypothetical protein SAMN05421780_104161 [Flexibacter flexilis DSM 6793]|uniref:Imelysin-like domain-containing protein n=1 Tax=Flexibacter flexilis DSM 6793 TaxID=927664 RepID=A0A1I1I1Q4_9BACT|nr:imelysin family protein [Flexibacter flexilis]SFC29752.1 hypothetical protein SAMN05421780_104161 [Flexibacter flexilis DSM 6793]
MQKIKLFLALAALVVLASCGNDSSNDGYDRRPMLEFYASQIIAPSFEQLDARVATLQTRANTFTQNPTEANLLATQTAWDSAFSAWQYAGAFSFTPSGELPIKLADELAVFPVSSVKIESDITNSTHIFTETTADNRGFLGVEYLIFDLENNNANIVSKFADTSRQNHLKLMLKKIKNKTAEMSNSWATNRSQFVANDGTDAGSSISILFNNFVASYEVLKNYKLRLPLGKAAGQIQAEPTKVEAYYSGKSLKMMQLHYTTMKNIWYGRTISGTDGAGFKEYLENVEGGTALISATELQLSKIDAAFAAIPATPSFSAQISSNKTTLDALYTEVQKNTRYFKGDMASLLGIAITYTSGDGD